MNNCRSSRGSALLLLLLVMATLTILMYSYWRSIAYDFELALERVAYQDQLQSVQGLLNYASSFARLNYDNLVKRSGNDPLVIPFAHWPPISQKNDTATLSFKTTGAAIQIEAFVGEKKQNVLHASCTLEQIKIAAQGQLPEKTIYKISQWIVHDAV